jgi:hypothetical protein
MKASDSGFRSGYDDKVAALNHASAELTDAARRVLARRAFDWVSLDLAEQRALLRSRRSHLRRGWKTALAARHADGPRAELLWGAVEAAAENEPRATTTAALGEYQPYLERVRGASFDQAGARLAWRLERVGAGPRPLRGGSVDATSIAAGSTPMGASGGVV